jgi:hypothetical protein
LRRVSKYHGMDIDLELLRDTGRQVSSHGSYISERLGCIPGPMVPGGMVFAACGVGVVNWLPLEAGPATELEGPFLFAKCLLPWLSSLLCFLTVIYCTVLVDHFS